MKRGYNCRLYTLFVLLILCNEINAQWRYIGQPGFSQGYASGIKIATDNFGGIYLAYYDWAHLGVTVAKSTGGSWQLLNDVVALQQTDCGDNSCTVFAVSPSGTPYIAYQWDTIVIKKYDYNSRLWERIDSGILGSNLAMGHSICTDISGNLYITLQNQVIGGVYVEKYDGSKWTLINGNVNYNTGPYQLFTDRTNGHTYLGDIDPGINGDIKFVDLSSGNYSSATYGEGQVAAFQADSGKLYWGDLRTNSAENGLLNDGVHSAPFSTNGVSDISLGNPSVSNPAQLAMTVSAGDIYMLYSDYYYDTTYIFHRPTYGQYNWDIVAFPANESVNTNLTFASDNYGNLYVAFSDPAYNGRVSVKTMSCIPDEPTLTSTSLRICAGDSAILHIASGNLNSAISWQWNINNCSGDSLGRDSVFHVSPDSTTTYYVHGVGGCAVRNNCASITIVVDTLVAASISISTITDSICAGKDVIFNAHAINGDGAQYIWLKNGVPISNNSTMFTINSIANDDSISCLLIPGLCAIADTVISNTIKMHVTPYPPAQIAVNGPLIFCQGDSVTIGVPGGNYNYVWSTGSIASSVIIYNTGTYTVTISQNGCMSYDTISLTASLSGLQPVISPGTLLHVCSDSVILNAGNGYDSYLWSTGDTTNSISVSNAGIYSVSVTQNICAGAGYDTIITGSYIVPLQLLPSDPVIYVCSGDSVTLHLSDNFSSYLWNTGSANSSITVYNSDSIEVTVTKYGCTGSAGVYVQKVSVPAPVILHSDSLGSVCYGTQVKLSVTSYYDKYNWSNGAITSEIAVTDTGNYNVTVSLNSCSATGTGYVSFVAGNSYNLLLTDSTLTSYGTNIYKASPGGAYSYLWQLSNDTTSNVSNSNITPYDTLVAQCLPSEGVDEYKEFIRVITTRNNGCVDTSGWYYNNICTNINDVNIKSAINIYPNPTSGQLKIELTEGLTGNTYAEIYNDIGQSVFSVVLSNDTSVLNLMRLSPGLYIIKIFNNGSVIAVNKVCLVK